MRARCLLNQTPDSIDEGDEAAEEQGIAAVEDAAGASPPALSAFDEQPPSVTAVMVSARTTSARAKPLRCAITGIPKNDLLFICILG